VESELILRGIGLNGFVVFSGSGLQNAADEFWSIDNMDVSAPVPTPEIWASPGLGLGILALAR